MSNKELIQVIAALESIAESKSTLPCLQNIRIGDRAYRSTDLENELVVTVGGSSTTPVCVNAKKALQVLRAGGTIADAGNAGDAEEYPARFDFQGASVVATLQSSVLSTALKAVEKSMSKDETRYNICCALLESTENNIRFVATDGHRLSMQDIRTFHTPNVSVLIPSAAITFLCKYLPADKDIHVGIGVSKNGFIQFRWDCSIGNMWTLTSRLIDGQFPDYKQVLPSENALTWSAKVDATAAANAVKLASAVLEDKTKCIRVCLDDTGIRFLGKGTDGASKHVTVDAATGGVDINTEEWRGVNAKHLADIFAVLKKEDVIIRGNGVLSPIVITSDDREGYYSLIMPMRIE